MSLTLPTLSPDLPRTLRTQSVDPAHAKLAYAMVNAGLMAPPDLRVGGGGLRRMVEKPFARWWNDSAQPRRMTNQLQFFIETDFTAGEARSGEPWLVLRQGGQSRRYYLIQAYGPAWRKDPEAAEHALAVLYRALDTFSYSLTPPIFLQFARRYWWQGGDDLAPGERKRTGFLSRKMFETRFHPSTFAPRLLPGRHPWKEVIAVEEALRARPLLTRNAHAITAEPVCDFPLILRWRSDDQHRRLMDHWITEDLDEAPHQSKQFTGAWPLRTTDDLRHARDALPNTARLIHRTDQLLARLAHFNFGGFYT